MQARAELEQKHMDSVEKLRMHYEDQSLHDVIDGDVRDKMEQLVARLQAENQAGLLFLCTILLRLQMSVKHFVLGQPLRLIIFTFLHRSLVILFAGLHASTAQ